MCIFFSFFLKFIEDLTPSHRDRSKQGYLTPCDGKTIEHQFDSFCKTVLRNYARDIYDENKRRNDYLVSLESLSLAELSKLSILDDYDSNYICMVSYDYNIRIEDVLIHPKTHILK